MSGSAPSVLFVGKQGDFYCDRAAEYVRLHVPSAEVVTGRRGDPLPEACRAWRGDYLVSYLSPWIVPQDVLDRARVAAINFHPGPPEYPGIGCTNFALYEGAREFGVTCHHMAARVDTGAVIAVRRFPVFATDTVFSLTQRCYAQILALFDEVVSGVLQGRPLPASDERWTRRPFTRKELNALCEVRPDMPPDEVARRVRAVSFPGMPGAYVEVHGHRFEFTAPVATRAGV